MLIRAHLQQLQVRFLCARSSEEGGIHACMRCLLTVLRASGTRLEQTEPEGETIATSRGGACRLLLDLRHCLHWFGETA